MRAPAAAVNGRCCILSIVKFFGQIADNVLIRTPSLFVALDLHPFRVGELGERLGGFLGCLSHRGGSSCSATAAPASANSSRFMVASATI
jgi:hypothetical protein